MDDSFICRINQHHYQVSFGPELLGPLAGTPQIRLVSELQDSFVYDNHESLPVGRKLLCFTAEIILAVKNIDDVFGLLSKFTCGERIDQEEYCKKLAFIPLLEAGEHAASLIFPRAYLMPELEFFPYFENDHSAKIRFRALPGTDGKLFTFL